METLVLPNNVGPFGGKSIRYFFFGHIREH